jgi:hypothetical protein
MRPPEYVVERIRHDPPADCHVVEGSTPVVAFGDPRSSPIATLGLNPSRIEFEVSGTELDGPLRRFETLRSLGLERLSNAPAEAVDRIWGRCLGYFHGNPYRRWFDRLEEMVAALGASYYADTACHLDLSQWATDPTWNGLSSDVRRRLVREDLSFLREQLQTESIRLLLLNGRAVVQAFERIVGDDLRPERETVRDRSVTTTLFTGSYAGIAVVGWSTNLQSGFGVTKVLRQLLAERVGELGSRR